MKWVETFTHDEIEPSEYDSEIKIWIQYCLLHQNRKTLCHFAKEFIQGNNCINAKFLLHCIFLKVIYLIMMLLAGKFAVAGLGKFQNIGCLQKDVFMHPTKLLAFIFL